jgi:hypothetical protein
MTYGFSPPMQRTPEIKSVRNYTKTKNIFTIRKILEKHRNSENNRIVQIFDELQKHILATFKIWKIHIPQSKKVGINLFPKAKYHIVKLEYDRGAAEDKRGWSGALIAPLAARGFQNLLLRRK